MVRYPVVVGVDRIEARLVVQAEDENDGINPGGKLQFEERRTKNR